MSVAFTEQAVRERRKTVTRRKGWTFLKPGDRLTLCRKVMGRKPGEPLERICDVEVVSVRRERLLDINNHEVALEGFPGMYDYEFVDRFFVQAQGMSLHDIVTRIEWKYLPVAASSVLRETKEAATVSEPSIYEMCTSCRGSTLGMNGLDIGYCTTCNGAGEVRKRDERGRFVAAGAAIMDGKRLCGCPGPEGDEQPCRNALPCPDCDYCAPVAASSGVLREETK